VTRAPLLLAPLLAALALAAPARASDWPMQLPGFSTIASASSDPDTWIVGARPGAQAAKIARRFHAQHIGLGGYTVAIGRARAMAGALRARHLLVYAQPNVYVHPAQVADDPLSGFPNGWRKVVADPALTPPPVTPTSPLIALVDAAADTTHPEWTGDPNFRKLGTQPVTNLHGTATAAVAAAPANGVGILGVWPGARALNVPLDTSGASDNDSFTCAASGQAIAKAIAAGAAVINMSYGSDTLCAPEKVQIYYGVAKGIIPVAAAGNEFEEGNPLEYPANLPHVITVAATDSADHSAEFSNANDWVDLSAPGVNIETAVPPALDEDGVKDGYQVLSGTSFSAPMVSAAMAWVRAARPDLQPDQVEQAVRLSARDVGRKGWDSLTGFGVLDVGNALSVPSDRLPAHDPGEPNDNIAWVNGQAFGTPAVPVWSGGKQPIRFDALLDKEEDPVDVYRVVVPSHHRAKISGVPRFGDIQLEVFKASAKSINDMRHRLAYSHRNGSKHTEHATIRNTGKAAHSYYVMVRPQGRSVYQDRRYTLRVGPQSAAR
jgi:hypothetical protein